MTDGNGNGQRVFQTMTLAISGVSLLMSLGFAFYTTANPKGDIQAVTSMLNRESDRLEGEILRMKNFASNNLLTKEEHREFARRLDKASDNLRDELNRIRSDQVTRSEHQQHWAETGDRITAVRDLNVQLRKEFFDSIAALQKDIGGQYTIGDQIKSLQNQIQQLNTRLDRKGQGASQ